MSRERVHWQGWEWHEAHKVFFRYGAAAVLILAGCMAVGEVAGRVANADVAAIDRRLIQETAVMAAGVFLICCIPHAFRRGVLAERRRMQEGNRSAVQE